MGDSTKLAANALVTSQFDYCYSHFKVYLISTKANYDTYRIILHDLLPTEQVQQVYICQS